MSPRHPLLHLLVALRNKFFSTARPLRHLNDCPGWTGAQTVDLRLQLRNQTSQLLHFCRVVLRGRCHLCQSLQFCQPLLRHFDVLADSGSFRVLLLQMSAGSRQGLALFDLNVDGNSPHQIHLWSIPSIAARAVSSFNTRSFASATLGVFFSQKRMKGTSVTTVDVRTRGLPVHITGGNVQKSLRTSASQGTSPSAPGWPRRSRSDDANALAAAQDKMELQRWAQDWRA